MCEQCEFLWHEKCVVPLFSNGSKLLEIKFCTGTWTGEDVGIKVFATLLHLVCLLTLQPILVLKANLTVVIISISLLSLQFLLLHDKSWLLLSWLFTCSLPGTDFCCCCSITKTAWLCPTCLVCDVKYFCFLKVLLCPPDVSKSSAFEIKPVHWEWMQLGVPKSKNRVTVCTYCVCVYI